jgi:hypothetical protein
MWRFARLGTDPEEKTHDNAIRCPLGVKHVLLRMKQEVPHHLSVFGFKQPYMLLFAHGLHEMLMHRLPECPPGVSMVHDK